MVRGREEEVHLGEPVLVEAVVEDRPEHLGEPDLRDGPEARGEAGAGDAEPRDLLVDVASRGEGALRELAHRAVDGVGRDDGEARAGEERAIGLEPAAKVGEARLAGAGSDSEDLLVDAERLDEGGEVLFQAVHLGLEVLFFQETDQRVEARVREVARDGEVRLRAHPKAVGARVALPLVEEAHLKVPGARAAALEEDAADGAEEEARGAGADHGRHEARGRGRCGHGGSARRIRYPARPERKRCRP